MSIGPGGSVPNWNAWTSEVSANHSDAKKWEEDYNPKKLVRGPDGKPSEALMEWCLGAARNRYQKIVGGMMKSSAAYKGAQGQLSGEVATSATGVYRGNEERMDSLSQWYRERDRAAKCTTK